jgi:putative N6-adenine-specific DNA methylase
VARFRRQLWDDVVARSRARIRDAAAMAIIAADRHGGAIAAAHANAGRAGVAGDITFLRQPLSALVPPAGTGTLLTNPPYGVRVGEKRELRALYAALGAIARERLGGWHAGLLAADAALAAATGLPLEEWLATRNGGIPVRLLGCRVP